MKIKFYGYNAFLIESGDKKIAIDPGAIFFYWFRLTTLIPKSEWDNITHIFITHGDPDHYWHADRVASASNASVICNKMMARNIHGKVLMLGPRDKGLAFTTEFANLHTLSVDETIEIDDMSITGIKTTHGELVFKWGPFSKTLKPGTDERIGWGAIGFEIKLDGKTIVNLGDTLLHVKEWQTIYEPDVLMIPIGGKTVHNTMDVEEAIQAVKNIHPKLVIPCHYNCPAFFTKTYNPADDALFKREVEKAGSKCVILGAGNSFDFADE
ncbi:MAG: MBL fold metallo-hydrolase [Burkholderiales bacterium]|nr:MBL fold metallo-hydrolase [Nitrosomonas sp.]MCP5274253.1 MBL fold metallo-hydrolase [Burkholderiales bacterium]